jgi:hypothetical protein
MRPRTFAGGRPCRTSTARLIGQYSYINVSRSHSKAGSSSSRQESKDDILSVADLTALPRFRAILLASGALATMIETIPWMNGPHAQKVKDCLATKETVRPEPGTVPTRPWTDGDKA